jgi:hypothetical protein
VFVSIKHIKKEKNDMLTLGLFFCKMIHLLDGKPPDTTIHDRSTVQLVNITKRAMAAIRE